MDPETQGRLPGNSLDSNSTLLKGNHQNLHGPKRNTYKTSLYDTGSIHFADDLSCVPTANNVSDTSCYVEWVDFFPLGHQIWMKWEGVARIFTSIHTVLLVLDIFGNLAYTRDSIETTLNFWWGSTLLENYSLSIWIIFLIPPVLFVDSMHVWNHATRLTMQNQQHSQPAKQKHNSLRVWRRFHNFLVGIYGSQHRGHCITPTQKPMHGHKWYQVSCPPKWLVQWPLQHLVVNLPPQAPGRNSWAIQHDANLHLHAWKRNCRWACFIPKSFTRKNHEFFFSRGSKTPGSLTFPVSR